MPTDAELAREVREVLVFAVAAHVRRMVDPEGAVFFVCDECKRTDKADCRVSTHPSWCTIGRAADLLRRMGK